MPLSIRLLLTFALGLGCAVVGLGAFGSHALRTRLGPEGAQIWKTASLYGFVHAIAAIAVGLLLLSTTEPHLFLLAAGWVFLAGVGLFSGSLYLISLVHVKRLGFVTPLGGILLIVGWLLAAIGIWI